MSETDYNPARRLHDIISAGPTPGDGKTVWNVFSEILEVPETNSAELWVRIAHVIGLPSTIKTTIECIPEADPDLYLTWYPKAMRGVQSFGVKNSWKSFIAYYPPENMMALNFCAHILSKHQPEKKIKSSDLSSLLQQVNELIIDLDRVEVRSADWLFMHHHLRKIKNVLERYAVTGIRPIEDVYEQAVGAMLLNRDVRETLQNEEKGKRFYKVIGVIATMLSIYGGISAITHDVSDIIDSQGLLSSGESAMDFNSLEDTEGKES